MRIVRRHDVADDVTRRLREVDDDSARGWLAWFPDGRMPRGAAKRPVMTLPYGCTKWSVTQYVKDWFEEEIRQGLNGNICRCGTYANVVMAAIDVVKGGRHG